MSRFRSNYKVDKWNRELQTMRTRKNNNRYATTPEVEARVKETGNITVQIIGGIVIGGCLLFVVVGTGYYLLNPYKRIEAVEDRLLITSKVVGTAIGNVMNIANERQLKMQRERATIEVEKVRQIEEIRQAKKAEDAAKKIKDAAFKRYWQKPEKCYSPELSSLRIECANEYIRARAKFEESYQAN